MTRSKRDLRDEMQSEARAFDGKLAHVPEPAMRRALVREWLEVTTPADGHAGLRAALEGPDGPLRETVRAVLTAPVGAPGEGLRYEQVRALYAQAVGARDETTARLLRASGGAGGPLRSEEPPLPRDLVDVPLGRRRSLARGTDPGWLERLARDTDPIVIRHWLQNPRIREADVVRLAAQRPVSRCTLEEIARHERWQSSGAVRSALARNPHSPLAVALRAVEGLELTRVRQVARDPDIHREVKEAARARFGRRRAFAEPPPCAVKSAEHRSRAEGRDEASDA